jgi:hypothetical protein
MRSTRLGTRLLKEKPGADDHGAGLSSFVVSLVLLVSAVTAAGNGPVEEMLAAARCEAAVRIRVRQWDGDLTGALLDPPAPTGLRSARVPTGAMGRWLRIVEDARRELVVDRITATRVDRLRFDEVCAATAHVVATQLPSPDAFGDSELTTRVARGERGVFLLWSPHMPLSVDQHVVLADVARELGLEVVPLLDPGADAGYAAQVARARNLPASATRPLGGIELAFRGMTTHTPSLQLFAGGRLVGPVHYGYRSAAALRQTLESVLGPR